MKRKNTIFAIISVIVWILIWYFAALRVNKAIFLPGPIQVIKALWSLMKTPEFYQSILLSLAGIAKGFLIGLVGGIILAVMAFKCHFMEVFINVPVRIIKAIPVASFVILSLLWLSAENLSILIAALMVLPIIYTNILTGLKDTDSKMLEFAKVYRLPVYKKIRYIYIPAVFSPMITACSVAVGYAWKSGIAAEIIGLIKGSIGNELYKSKLYLETANMFAWTIAIIIVSYICEKTVVALLSLTGRTLGGIPNGKRNDNQ